MTDDIRGGILHSMHGGPMPDPDIEEAAAFVLCWGCPVCGAVESKTLGELLLSVGLMSAHGATAGTLACDSCSIKEWAGIPRPK